MRPAADSPSPGPWCDQDDPSRSSSRSSSSSSGSSSSSSNSASGSSSCTASTAISASISAMRVHSHLTSHSAQTPLQNIGPFHAYPSHPFQTNGGLVQLHQPQCPQPAVELAHPSVGTWPGNFMAMAAQPPPTQVFPFTTHAPQLLPPPTGCLQAPGLLVAPPLPGQHPSFQAPNISGLTQCPPQQAHHQPQQRVSMQRHRNDTRPPRFTAPVPRLPLQLQQRFHRRTSSVALSFSVVRDALAQDQVATGPLSSSSPRSPRPSPKAAIRSVVQAIQHYIQQNPPQGFPPNTNAATILAVSAAIPRGTVCVSPSTNAFRTAGLPVIVGTLTRGHINTACSIVMAACTDNNMFMEATLISALAVATCESQRPTQVVTSAIKRCLARGGSKDEVRAWCHYHELPFIASFSPRVDPNGPQMHFRSRFHDEWRTLKEEQPVRTLFAAVRSAFNDAQAQQLSV